MYDLDPDGRRVDSHDFLAEALVSQDPLEYTVCLVQMMSGTTYCRSKCSARARYHCEMLLAA